MPAATPTGAPRSTWLVSRKSAGRHSRITAAFRSTKVATLLPGQFLQERRLHSLVPVKDEDRKGPVQLGPDHGRAAEVIALGMRLLAKDDDLVPRARPGARQGPGVDVRARSAQEVPMPEENLHDMDDPDGLLVRRARRGDRDAFERLVERHQHRLYTLAARLTGSRADAEDAVQEALIRAWLNLPDFRGGALFSTWLYRICANAAHDLRSKRRPEPSEAAVETPDPRDAFVDSELAGGLQAALNGLEDPYRTAVVLFDVLGCSYLEIAEVTGVPEGTVKSRIFRGRKELAVALGTSVPGKESKE